MPFEVMSSRFTSNGKPNLLLIRIFCLFVLALVGVFELYTDSFLSHFLVSQFGFLDWFSYWSSYQLFAKGENPYDAQALLSYQIAPVPDAARVYSPPWNLLLLSPLLSLPFSVSALALLILSILCSLGIFSCSLQFFAGRGDSRFFYILGIILCLPVWHAFAAGQFSLLLAYVCFLVVVNFSQERERIAGILCAILMMKPHLFYLFLIALFFSALQNSKWVFLRSFACTFGILLLALFLIHPQAINSWWQMSVPKIVWMGPSLWTGLHLGAYTLFSVKLPFLNTVFPILLALLTAIYFVLKKPTINWRVAFPCLLCASLATSPYIWFSDLSILVIVQLAIISITLSLQQDFHKAELFSYLIWLQGFSWLLYGSYANSIFFYYPIALGLVYWRALVLQKRFLNTGI